MHNITLQLEKLTCPSCMQKIIQHIEALTGVEKTKILFNASKARVFFDQTKLSEDTIINEIENIGYTAEKIK
jgi:copper chaperone CopZ